MKTSTIAILRDRLPKAIFQGKDKPFFHRCSFHDFVEPHLTNKLYWIPRTEAELADSEFVHIIPYIKIRIGSSYLAYKRGKESERRLDPFWSIGYGGHIEFKDLELLLLERANVWNVRPSLQRLITSSAIRELNEELPSHEVISIKMIGIVYDPISEVGRLHLGIVLNAESSLEDPSLENSNLLSFDQLKEKNLEPWSKLILEE